MAPAAPISTGTGTIRAERPCGDHQLELGWLHHWHISWLSPLRMRPVSEANPVRLARATTHQASCVEISG